MLSPGQFERRVTTAGGAAILGVVVVAGFLTYWQAWRTDLADEDTNPRVLEAFRDPNRGRILDRDGNILAESLPDGSRRYTDASVAHLVGYIDPRYGSQGAELVFNSQLSGQERTGIEGAFDAEFRREKPKGEDVRLTIDPVVQRAAAAALGSQAGAIVAVNPRNGEVLASVSVPTYDPGSLETDGEALFNDPSSPLLNRVTMGLYPPGSTFKTITAISALENGVITPDTTVTCPGEIVFDGFPISCANVTQGIGTYPFSDAFAFSVNAIFAQVGVATGWDGLKATAARFGIGSNLPFTLPTAATQLHNPGTEESTVLLANTAFGQGELLVTPLQMVEIAATVANGGVLVQPHLGAGESGPSSRLMSAELAATMNSLMQAVVDKGQANGVAIQGVKVAGKTGTAETGTAGVSHAWFIAFAPADNPVITLAVIVENGGKGSQVAAPIAGQVLRAALGR